MHVAALLLQGPPDAVLPLPLLSPALSAFPLFLRFCARERVIALCSNTRPHQANTILSLACSPRHTMRLRVLILLRLPGDMYLAMYHLRTFPSPCIVRPMVSIPVTADPLCIQWRSRPSRGQNIARGSVRNIEKQGIRGQLCRSGQR